MFFLKPCCIPMVAMVFTNPVTREVGEKGKKTQEAAAMARRAL